MTQKLPILQEIKAIKTKKEIDYITKAQRIAEEALLYVLPLLKERMTEEKVVSLISTHMQKQGVKVLPFPIIVAFGKNTGHVHHEPCKAKLKKGDAIMFDFGATISGFCSDMTRMYFFGKPTKRQTKMYETVLSSQEKVLNAIAKGERNTRKLDRIARTLITKRFGAKVFPHSLGHGIGTVIHEWPFLSQKSEEQLQEGMVITIEPGVYFKDGGVRIEDAIVITKNGYTNLTKPSKRLEDCILKV